MPEIYAACLSQFAAAVREMYGGDSAFAIAAETLLSSGVKEKKRKKPMSNDVFIVEFRKEYAALFRWASLRVGFTENGFPSTTYPEFSL